MAALRILVPTAKDRPLLPQPPKERNTMSRTYKHAPAEVQAKRIKGFSGRTCQGNHRGDCGWPCKVMISEWGFKVSFARYSGARESSKLHTKKQRAAFRNSRKDLPDLDIVPEPSVTWVYY